MLNLSFDSGLKEYTINNKATLLFNPSDPEMYRRFFSMIGDIERIGQEMAAAIGSLTGNDKADVALTSMSDADKKIKICLSKTFGEHNDFNAIFEGVSSFAGTDNGEWVITNFLNAIRPIIEEGAQKSLEAKVAAAKHNREQRRATLKK